VAAGYPRAIAADWAGLPDSIDAAFTWPGSGATYIFKGHPLKFLKVDGNEKLSGSEKWNWLGISLGLWRWMAICHLNMQLLCKKNISFSACYSFINRRCLGKFHPFDPLCLFKM
jgi:hypothetical protein